MANKGAVLLDTNVIGERIKLEDILADKENDFYVVPGILDELETWRKKEEHGITSTLTHHRQKSQELENLARNNNYQEIAGYVEIVDDEHPKDTPNPYIVRLLYEAFKSDLQINFTARKNHRKLKEYFSALLEKYQPAIDALVLGSKKEPRGLKAEVADDHIEIYAVDKYSSERIKKQPGKVIDIVNIDELEREFRRYEFLKRTHDD
ncbi:TPA: hypothetical protein HA246_03320 [Candidatus Woesearchaeota archaeon]|nr:hypothetical protein [Candidatus Woesearchaeota archaeon]